MTLAELLEAKFRADVRFRGAAYIKAERVAITRVTPDELFGVVRDGVEYQTQLSRVDGRLKLFCNCARTVGTDATCKHLWATVLLVDEGDYFSGELKADHVPAFLPEPSFALTQLDLEADDEDAPGDFFKPASRRMRSVAVAPPAEEGWRARLTDVRLAMAAEPVAAQTANREQQVFYEIDLEQSRAVGQIVVQTSHRQRRANGQWGLFKPLRLRSGKLEEQLGPEDARILAYLSGGTPERTNWYAQQAEMQTSVFRFRLPYELCELIMPMMCVTGRVRVLNSDERNAAPIEWDDGPPYELALRVLQNEPGDDWQVEGQLTRENEILPIAKTALLVPGGLVLAGHRIARLRDFGAFSWINLLQKESGFTIPAGEEHDFIDRLLDMPALPRLDLPESLRLEEVPCDPVPRLTLRTPRGALLNGDRLQGEVSFDYFGSIIGASSAQWAIVQREQGRCVLRNRPREEEHWGRLLDQGFRRTLDPRRTGRDVEISVRSLGAAVRGLVQLGWQVQADGKAVRQPSTLSFRVESQIDWFELHATADFEGRSIRFPDLVAALSRGDTTVRLDDGSLGILPEEWIRSFGLLAGLGSAEEDHVRFAPNTIMLLDALLAAQPQINYDSRFLELREQLGERKGVETAAEPAGFHGTLREYQKDGLGWLKFLQRLNFGGCLADDMGLGKTIQLLALLLDWKASGQRRGPSLVVVPKSLLFNWRSESEKFAPTLKTVEYSGLQRDALRKSLTKHDLVLTTYGTLRRDISELKDIGFDYVVLDEAQTIKNAGSQIAKASRLLSARHRLALSGTPIENHLGDLWSIFEFINPGMLGRSSIFKMYVSDEKEGATRDALAQGLRPFILRRTKNQVAAELPEKVEQTIYCNMRKEQRRLYNELRDAYRSSLLGEIDRQGLAKSKMHVLEALLRLRQMACHPALIGKGEEDEPGAKLEVLLPQIDELIEEGHKALVFSQFTSMLAIVRKHLDEKGVTYEYLDGQTRDRKERVERFQSDPACGVFLVSLKAGGLGLNLTAADYVFLLDPWWNPAVESQAIDRAHRVGQMRRVFAYRLICRNTVEEKIAELQGKKKNLADAILQADANLLKELTVDDLVELLS